MYSSLFKDELSTKRRNFHYVVVVFGTLCGLISFVLSFIELVKAFTEDEEAEAVPEPKD